jgi:hypothetical protein
MLVLSLVSHPCAHSVDRERPFRPIVNTESGDHERSLAVA